MEDKDPIENEISYVPMEEDFREEVKQQFRKPVRKGMAMLTITFLILYLIILNALVNKNGEKVESVKDVGGVMLILAAYIGFFFFICMLAVFKSKVHYLKDANLGQIAKEKVHITKVMETPAGINIYWVDSNSVMTFTPEPYRNFKEGDAVTIYYLKFSKEYLAYEV